jgi:hypothetical protein
VLVPADPSARGPALAVHLPNVFLRACITRAPKPNDLELSNHVSAERGNRVVGQPGEAGPTSVSSGPAGAVDPPTRTGGATRGWRRRSVPLWRCRESNPGPPLLLVGFSVRSPLCLYSDPPITRTSRCDDPSRCSMSPSTPRPGGRVSPLADAGHRIGERIRADSPYLVRPRGRDQTGQCAYQRHLFFCDGWFSRSSSPSSARFTTIDIRSRNRSPPSRPVSRASAQHNAARPGHHPRTRGRRPAQVRPAP